MILPDSNVWLALALSKHEFHATVRTWLGEQKSSESVLFCRSTQQSFLRLLTTSAVLAPYGVPPLSNKKAWSVYEGYLADGRISWVDEPNGVDAHLTKFAGISKASPKLWMDAYLAAFAVAGKYQLVTIDMAFKQFKELDLVLLSRA
jgi:toxin-antitoxin system PIN domain toxin